MIWTAELDDDLRRLYSAVPNAELARQFGVTPAAIRNRAWRLEITGDRSWSEEDIRILSEAYRTALTSEELNIRGMALDFSRSYNAVVTKAGKMGLTNLKRKGVIAPRVKVRKTKNDEELRALQSANARERIARNGHPRGMAGKRHSDDTKAWLAVTSKRWNSTRTEEQKAAVKLKALKTKVDRYGTVAPNISRGSWMAGWREIGGKRNFYRSRWEANYARYLQWLKDRGDISDWQHEPETFWFEKIKRGVRSYLPDFRVWENDGTTKLHEVKGWMDKRSKTCLNRMRIYHPKESVIVIRQKQYYEIYNKLGRLLPGWEWSARDDRS